MKGTTSASGRQSSRCYWLEGSPQQTILGFSAWAWFQVWTTCVIPHHLQWHKQWHTTEVKPMGLLCTQSCWQEHSAEERQEACSANPSFPCVNGDVHHRLSWHWPATAAKPEVSFVCNLCWADESLLCIIRSFLVYNTLLVSLQKSILEWSKLICLFLVLTFLLIFRMWFPQKNRNTDLCLGPADIRP